MEPTLRFSGPSPHRAIPKAQTAKQQPYIFHGIVVCFVSAVLGWGAQKAISPKTHFLWDPKLNGTQILSNRLPSPVPEESTNRVATSLMSRIANMIDRTPCGMLQAKH